MAAEMPIIIILEANNLGNLTHTVAWLNPWFGELLGWLASSDDASTLLCIGATILKYSL